MPYPAFESPVQSIQGLLSMFRCPLEHQTNAADRLADVTLHAVGFLVAGRDEDAGDNAVALGRGRCPSGEVGVAGVVGRADRAKAEAGRDVCAP